MSTGEVLEQLEGGSEPQNGLDWWVPKKLKYNVTKPIHCSLQFEFAIALEEQKSSCYFCLQEGGLGRCSMGFGFRLVQNIAKYEMRSQSMRRWIGKEAAGLQRGKLHFRFLKLLNNIITGY